MQNLFLYLHHLQGPPTTDRERWTAIVSDGLLGSVSDGMLGARA